MIADLEKLVRLINKDQLLRSLIECKSIVDIPFEEKTYPVLAFTIGSKDPTHPTLFLTGGFHGLERIGVQLAWSLLKTTVDRLVWDQALRELFQNIRLVVVPLVNPTGYFGSTRSNAQGVDLMRNSPVRALEGAPFLLGGQRLSKNLPWFQGEKGEFEPENKALTQLFQESAAKSNCVVALDFHSGFGMRDRLWFPFSYTSTPFDHLPELNALVQLFEQTHPYHIYQIEPQSKGYLLSGDVWDYLFINYTKWNKQGVFIPLTLEMGSWTWVRKNPLQLFSRDGVFNPIKQHRVKRTYRRHHLLFDFLLKAINSHKVWAKLDASIRQKHEQLASKRWYDDQL